MASIRKRGSVWQARIARKGYPVLYRTFDTKSDAAAWSQDQESKMHSRRWRDHRPADENTLADILTRYRIEVTPTKRGATQEHSKVGVILRHHICLKALSALSSADLADYRDDRLAVVGDKTVRDELGLIRRVINVAQSEWGIVLSHGNPVDQVTKPKPSQARNRRLTVEEYRQLITAACSENSRAKVPIAEILVLAVETAMRRGELVGLQWHHIDLDAKTAHLHKEITKSGEARDVPLSSVAIGILDSLGKKSTGKVFTVTGDGITQAFERLVKAAQERYVKLTEEDGDVAPYGFLTDLRFHDLRHEATSRLAKIFQPHELAKITGHKTLQMVMRYYHPTAEDLAGKLD